MAKKDGCCKVKMPMITVAGVNHYGEACLFVRPIFEFLADRRFDAERWLGWWQYKLFHTGPVVPAVKRRLPRKMKPARD